MATFLPVSGERLEISPAHGAVFTHEELQQKLGGEYGFQELPSNDTHLLVVLRLAVFMGKPKNSAASQMTIDGIYGDALLASKTELGRS